MNSLVSIRQLVKTYRRGPETINVLQGLNLEIQSGEFVTLMGPSGSGKTTLLNLCGGLDTPTQGEIEINGQHIEKMSSAQLSHWRAANVGFIFQFYNLLPILTAKKMLSYRCY